jgi:hypothetical protein
MTDNSVFSKAAADWILKRAAEIEGTQESGPVSVEELRSIAGEAGFGQKALELAIAEAERAAAEGAHRPPVQKWGIFLVRLATVRTLPVEVSSGELMRAVRLFQPYREGPAQVKLEEGQITWRDRKGIRFTVSSGGGVTEIRVIVSKFLVRRGRWMGWVKAAADRLETLIFMVSAQGHPGPRAPIQLPAP